MIYDQRIDACNIRHSLHIGKIQQETNARLLSFGKGGQRVQRQVKQRLRTKVRLYEKFRVRCRQR
jgi:hypothetical protein